ncbi:hypothetical protein Glove_83g8 [Diversispora epigaea]|uniref:Uncharacterized protein n=1 Tax=Diversispora epigaea TaxID=1348612 RepID=A0A397JB44_9GLOM|nr:hypothetical protein Glove_83g8 [Diversispora epigaea]
MEYFLGGNVKFQFDLNHRSCRSSYLTSLLEEKWEDHRKGFYYRKSTTGRMGEPIVRTVITNFLDKMGCSRGKSAVEILMIALKETENDNDDDDDGYDYCNGDNGNNRISQRARKTRKKGFYSMDNDDDDDGYDYCNGDNGNNRISQRARKTRKKGS